MSNASGRSWYRFSSLVRPTPHSSRDTSPPKRHVIDSPPSPPPQPLSPPLLPPSPRSPPKEVKEANPSPVPSSISIKHDPRSTHEPPKPSHKHEKTNLVLHGQNNVQQQDSNISSGDVIMGTQGVITISGENKGAIMEIIQSPRKTRGESSDNAEGEKSKSKNDGNLPMDSFVNSNVQMINGSVVYNSTETHYDPGVHLSLYRKPSSSNGFIIKDHGNGYKSSIN